MSEFGVGFSQLRTCRYLALSSDGQLRSPPRIANCCMDVEAMSNLHQRGFIVTDGPFSFDETGRIARDYDHSFAVTPDTQIKRGRTSTRWGGLVAREPFYRIYLHEALLSAASERIGGPMKLSSFFARTLLPKVAAEPPQTEVSRTRQHSP
jgi:hypothetical protein